MPAQPKPDGLTPQEQARAVASVYYDAERRIVERVRAKLEKGLDVPDWERQALGNAQALSAEARDIMGKLPGSALWVETVAKAYGKGVNEAALPGMVAPLAKKQAVARIATELATRVDGTMANAVLRRTDDLYREAVGRTVAAAAARGMSLRDAAKETMADLFSQGIGAFEDSAGRNWRLGDYVDMATRTGLANAQIAGHQDALVANDVNLVVVQPGPRACDICDDWARSILSLDGSSGTLTVENLATGEPMEVEVEAGIDDARDDGFQHPNCRCTITAYLPGITDPAIIERPPWDQEGYEAQQQQRALEKDVREAQMAQATAMNPDDRLAAALQEAQARQALNDHLASNPDLKMQTDRTSIGGRFATEGERQAIKDAQAAMRDSAAALRAVDDVAAGAGSAAADLSGFGRIASETAIDAATRTNPYRALTPDYQNNCSYCVNAVELRVRGLDVIASPVSAALGRSTRQMAKDWVDAEGNTPEWTRISDHGNQLLRGLAGATESWPVGARGFVAGDYTKGRSGHVMNVEKGENGLRIIEGQVASSTPQDAAATFKRFKLSSVEVLRTDNLTPAKGIERSVQRADQGADAASVAAERARLTLDIQRVEATMPELKRNVDQAYADFRTIDAAFQKLQPRDPEYRSVLAQRQAKFRAANLEAAHYNHADAQLKRYKDRLRVLPKE